MRYFTPERYLQLQKVADDRSITAALDEWERALVSYGEELARIDRHLPAELRQFATRECLHDALLLASWMEDLRFSFLLYPEPPEERLFLLVFRLVEPPYIDRSAFSRDYDTPQMGWLYEELSLEQEPAQGEQGATPVFTLAILFSNGCEIRLRFREFSYSRPENVLNLGPPSASPSNVSQSA
jgi:hypothetical protein